MLAADGSNLAAVFATLRHIRQDSVDLDAASMTPFPAPYSSCRYPRKTPASR
jgi:predicted ATPase